jgi:serralysin
MSGSSGYDPLTGLDWGTKLSSDSNQNYAFKVYLYPAGTPVTAAAFAPDGSDTGTVTAQAWNAYQTAQLTTALQSLSDIANVSFSFTDSLANSTLRLVAGAFPPNEPVTPENDVLGVFGPPGTGIDAGLGGFNTAVSLWTSSAGGVLDVGGLGYVTLVHELGHGLGLAHPHDRGGGSTIFPGVTASMGSLGEFGLNQGIYTMMSYNDGWQTAPQGLPQTPDYGYQFTPMAFDVAVLQQKYGANMNYHTGDDTYVLPGANGQDVGYSCIWDAGGTNAFYYAGTGNAVIDLRPATLQFAPGGGGYVSYVQGVDGGYTIANGVTIKDAVGGSGNDLLQANDSGDLLDGNGGANTIIGGAGNDTVLSSGNDLIVPGSGANLVFLGQGNSTISSAGADTISCSTGTAVVTLTGGNAGLAFGGSGQLTYLNGSGASTVVGGTGTASVFGGTGSLQWWGEAGGGVAVGGSNGGNVLVAGQKASTLVGGGSGDLLVASGSADNVLIAAAGNATLLGGSGRSLISAGAGNDVVGLSSGNDTVFGGASGQTTVFGGAGTDLVSGGSGSLYVQAGSGQATVIAGNGLGLFGFAAGDGPGGTELIENFSTSRDQVQLRGYGPDAVSAALSSATVTNGSTTIVLSDNTRVTFAGISNLTSSSFV